MKNKLKNLTQNTFILNYWSDEIKKLEKKDIEINIADFDDTIFSRKEQLEKEKYLRENRGDLGPKAIAEVGGGINKYIDIYYKNKNFPKQILEKFDKKYDLILTAGVFEFQISKLVATGLDNYNFKITKNGQDKIIELIRYVIYDLKFIPSKITVYEDRPQYFIEYRDLIEDILGTKLEILFVEMDGNNGYKKIEKI